METLTDMPIILPQEQAPVRKETLGTAAVGISAGKPPFSSAQIILQLTNAR